MTDNIIENPGRTMWRDAARYGGIIGLALMASMLINEFSGHRLAILKGAIDFCVLVGFIYVFARRRSQIYGSSGFSFAQSIGYIILMMVFAGVITGVAEYLAVNFISPVYYEEAFGVAFESNPLIAANIEMYESSLEVIDELLKNPVIYIVGGVIGQIIYGGIIGLFVSAVIKRAPENAA